MLRILHLEGDALEAEPVHELLASQGLVSDIVRIETREEFEAALEQGEFDLILSERTLPAFDGMSALGIALQKRPDLPFIFVSGAAGEEVAVESIKSGATDYVLKQRLERLVPVTRRALREAAERRTQKNTEEALRESEARYRSLVETSPEAITLTDLQGKVVLCNQQALLMHGCGSMEEMVGRKAFEFIAPEDHERAKSAMSSVLLLGTVKNVEYSLLRMDGSRFPAEVNRSVLLDEQGDPKGFMSVQRDITDRKLAEETLRRSEELFAKAFRASPDAFIITRLSDSVLLDVNDSFSRILGYSREDAVGKPIAELNIWADISERDRMIAQLRAKGSVNEFETIFKKKSGDIGAGIISAQLTNIGGEYCMVAICRDVTERKRAEEGLRRSEELFSKAFRASPDAYIISRLSDGMLLDVNDSFSGTTGYSRDEVVGRPIAELNKIWSDLNDRDHMVAILRAEGSVRDFEAPYWKKSGEMGIGLTSVELVQIGGEPCVLTICRDITERKRAGEALRESEERYRTLIEQAADGIFLSDIKGNLIDVNEMGCAMLGYTRDEVLRLVIADVVEVRDPQTAQERAVDLASGKTLRAEHIMYRKDGTAFPVEISSKLLPGGIYQAFARDITVRKQVEEALLKSEERFRQAFDHASIGMALVSIEGGFTQVNRALCDFLGYSEAELLTIKFQEITHPDDLEANIEYARQLLTGEIQFYHMEKRYFHKDDHIVWGRLSVTLVRDVTGEPRNFVSQIEDISQRKLAEVAVAFERYLLNSLMETTHDSIYFKDKHSNFTRINRALAERLNLADPQEAIGKSDADFFSESLAAQSYNDEQEIIRTGIPVLEKEELEVWMDGSETYFVTSKMPLWDAQGHAIGTFSVSRDITSRMLEQSALRKSELKNRALIEAIPDLMVQIDGHGTILDFGAEKEDKLIMSPEQFIGKSLFNILPLDIAHEAIQNAEAALESGKMQCFEYQLPVRDGKHDFEARLVVSGQNEVVAIIRNITERKQAQDALTKAKEDLELRVEERTTALRETNDQLQHELVERQRAEDIANESLERLAEAQGIAQLGSWEWTANANKISWSDELFRMFGIEVQQSGVTLETYLNYIHPDDRERVGTDIEKAIQEKATFSNEARFLHSDGSVRFYQTRGTAVLNGAGEIVKVQGTVQDITERQQAEEALRKSEGLHRALARNLPNGAVLLFDRDLRFQLAEGVALEAQGYSKDLMIGHTIWEVLPPDLCADLVPHYRSALAGRKNSIESEYSGRFYLVHFVPVKNEQGEIFAGMAVSLDITEQKRSAEEARAAQEVAESANRAKSQFLSRMSHELRTPLNAILGFSQLLEISNLPDMQSEYVTYVLTAGEHLLGLINEVLDIASVEAGHASILLEPIEVSSAIHECLDLMKPLADQRNVSLDTGNRLEHTWHILADRQRLRQVLLNLVANAIKYNREGGNVSLACEEEGERLRIRVIDTGRGISKEKLAKLFTPFERLGAEQTGVEGTGLGLTLSKHLVEAMHGSLGVESIVDQGSVFWIELPLAERS